MSTVTLSKSKEAHDCANARQYVRSLNRELLRYELRRTDFGSRPIRPYALPWNAR